MSLITHVSKFTTPSLHWMAFRNIDHVYKNVYCHIIPYLFLSANLTAKMENCRQKEVSWSCKYLSSLSGPSLVYKLTSHVSLLCCVMGGFGQALSLFSCTVWTQSPSGLGVTSSHRSDFRFLSEDQLVLSFIFLCAATRGDPYVCDWQTTNACL